MPPVSNALLLLVVFEEKHARSSFAIPWRCGPVKALLHHNFLPYRLFMSLEIGCGCCRVFNDLVHTCTLVVRNSVAHGIVVIIWVLEVFVIIVLVVFDVLALRLELLLGFGPVDVLVASAAANDVLGVDLLHVFVIVICGTGKLVCFWLDCVVARVEAGNFCKDMVYPALRIVLWWGFRR